MINTHIIGVSGEHKASEYLKNKGYKIINMNYTCPIGEIDIICKYKDMIVFVEVKQRESLKYGYPREAVTSTKANKIRMVALNYLKYKRLTNQKIRFDVVDILGDKITHIENCF